MPCSNRVTAPPERSSHEDWRNLPETASLGQGLPEHSLKTVWNPLLEELGPKQSASAVGRCTKITGPWTQGGNDVEIISLLRASNHVSHGWWLPSDCWEHHRWTNSHASTPTQHSCTDLKIKTVCWFDVTGVWIFVCVQEILCVAYVVLP